MTCTSPHCMRSEWPHDAHETLLAELCPICKGPNTGCHLCDGQFRPSGPERRGVTDGNVPTNGGSDVRSEEAQ